MINFSQVSNISLPEGSVQKIVDASGVVLWEKQGGQLVSVTVNSSDDLGYLNILIVQSGSLTIGGIAITKATQVISVPSGETSIVYVCGKTLAEPRKLYVNGTLIGTATSEGYTLSTSVNVSEGSTITIRFTT